jgi:hypothetical protein
VVPDVRFHRPLPLTRTPRVSVVIPCYNYGHYLLDAVGSALSQPGVAVDVLVVDDASSDDSACVARRLAACDPRVSVLVHDRNAGHIRTYNEGLARVAGDYLVLLSADDALVPGALAAAASLMDHHPRVGMVYGHAASFSDAVPRTDSAPRSWSTWSGRTWLTSMCRRAKNPVYTPSVVMRREAWQDAGGYDVRVPHAADMLLWYQTALDWDIGRVNNEAQALYRVHGSNMHLSQYAGMLRDLTEQREVVRILFEEQRRGAPLPASLRAAAHRSMARRAERLAEAVVREAGSPAEARAYREFAAETAALASGATPSSWQRRVDHWMERGHAGAVRKVERHLEWRLWRRYGT